MNNNFNNFNNMDDLFNQLMGGMRGYSSENRRYLITAKTFTHNFLPRLGLALSLLATILVFFFLLKKRSFYYPKFIKFFWRAGFLLTLVMYIEMIVELFLMK